ncbi:MAG: DUF2288 family protein [Pseudomonadota bacterium]
MADGTLSGDDRRRQLTSDFLAQTARIPFGELQRYFAGGRVVAVADSLDLVSVAVELALDNAAQFQQWVDAGAVNAVSDDTARQWLEAEADLWAVVADPWVLVQLRDE